MLDDRLAMTDAKYMLLLAARRAQLVQRAQRQRRQLAQIALPLLRPWVWVERGFRLWRSLQAHPWLVLVPAGVLTLWRPRIVLRALPVFIAWWRTALPRRPHR
jgi:hypothetical protein